MLNIDITTYRLTIQQKVASLQSLPDETLYKSSEQDPLIFLVLAFREASKQGNMNVFDITRYLGIFLLKFENCMEGKNYVRAVCQMIYPAIDKIDTEKQLSDVTLFQLAEIQLLLREQSPSLKTVPLENTRKYTIENSELGAFFSSLNALMILRMYPNETKSDFLEPFTTDTTCQQVFARFKLLFIASLKAYYDLRFKEQTGVGPAIAALFNHSKKDWGSISAMLSPEKLKLLQDSDIETFSTFIKEGAEQFPAEKFNRLGPIFLEAQTTLAVFKAAFGQASRILTCTAMEAFAAKQRAGITTKTDTSGTSANTQMSRFPGLYSLLNRE